MNRAWVLLTIAGVLEVGWAIGLKYSDGFRKPLASTLTMVALVASFWLLAQALKTLPVGTGYAVWTGIGAAECRSDNFHPADRGGYRGVAVVGSLAGRVEQH